MSIEDEEQEQMFRSLAAICQNAQQQEGSLDLSQVHPGELWSSLQRADASSHRGIQDVAALQTIKSVLDQMNWKQSQFLVAATKVLADASREREHTAVINTGPGRVLTLESRLAFSFRGEWRF